MFDQNENAAPGRAAFSKCREHSSTDSQKIGSAPRGVNGNRLLATLTRVGGLQRFARRRLNDPAEFDWRRWADFVANELLAATPGVHIDRHSETDVIDRPFERTTVTKTRVKRVTWPKTCAATVLCYGRHRLFETLDQAPPAIVAAVEAGVADALARGRHVRFTAEDIARALGITAAEKLAIKAWQVGCCDLTPEEWAALMLKRKTAQQRESRHAKKGVKPREESVAAMARAIGVKPNTLQKKLRRARRKAEKADAQDVLFSKQRNNKKDRVASKKGHEKTSQHRHTPGRPKDGSAGEGVGRDVKKPSPLMRERFFPIDVRRGSFSPVASPTLSAAADSALSSAQMA